MEAPPSAPPLVVLFLVLVISSSSSAFLSNDHVNYEVQALIAIRSLLKDPDGVLLSWDPASVDPCSWPKVACSPDFSVTALEAPGQNLSGVLSPSVVNLTNLEFLVLQNNNITGHIPAEIGKLSRLKELNLSGNHLYGGIPSSVAGLSLQYLDLSYNNLSGPVPRSLATTFYIAGNPLICSADSGQDYCSKTAQAAVSYNLKTSQASDVPVAETTRHKLAVAFGSTIGCIIFLFFR